VQAIKDNRLLIKAKHEERTSDRLSKSKYSKEFELPEKINTHSIRGGLCADGRLIVGAFVKVLPPFSSYYKFFFFNIYLKLHSS